MSLRCRAAATAGVGEEPPGPLTFMVRPSANSMLSKKHMYGSCRDREPETRIFVPGLKICGVIPMRLSCVVPCDSHTYSRVRPFSSTAFTCRFFRRRAPDFESGVCANDCHRQRLVSVMLQEQSELVSRMDVGSTISAKAIKQRSNETLESEVLLDILSSL